MSSLTKEVIKLSHVRQTSKRELSTALDAAVNAGNSRKIIFLDPKLSPSLQYSGIATEAFKQGDVVGIYALEEGKGFVGVPNAVYLVRPSLDLLKTLATHVSEYKKKFPESAVFVYFVPHRTLLCETILMEEYNLKAMRNCVIADLPLEWFPLEDDVMSMELTTCVRDLFVDGDTTCLHGIARALIGLMASRVGLIPVIRGKGKHAAKVVRMMQRMQDETGTTFLAEQPSEVVAMYVIDRTVDWVTPFLTQLTYEGAIDEHYGITVSHFDPPFALLPQDNPTAPHRDRFLSLHGDDRIFADIRDRHVVGVGGALNEKSRWVKQFYDKRDELQKASGLKELKEFMKALPEMQEQHRLITQHTTLLTQLNEITNRSDFRRRISVEQSVVLQEDEAATLEYVMDRIFAGDPLASVLRLVCLLSVVSGGLKNKVYESLRDAMMVTYGIPQCILVFQALDRAGVLRREGEGSTKAGYFGGLRKSLPLWAPNLQERKATDVAYAYSGYTPILTRVVECALSGTWGTAGSASEVVAGEMAEIVNHAEVVGSTRVVIVFVIGGITFAEISTLRFIAQQQSARGEPVHLVLATTHITNGTKLLKSMIPFSM